VFLFWQIVVLHKVEQCSLIVTMLWCAVDDTSDLTLKTHRPVHSLHNPVDIQHVLPLSVEAQFVRDVIDRVSVVNLHTVNYISTLWLIAQFDSSQCISMDILLYINSNHYRVSHIKLPQYCVVIISMSINSDVILTIILVCRPVLRQKCSVGFGMA